jgi:hypothetical protein
MIYFLTPLLLQVDLCKQLVDQLDASIVPDKELIIAGALAKSGTRLRRCSVLDMISDKVGLMVVSISS